MLVIFYACAYACAYAYDVMSMLMSRASVDFFVVFSVVLPCPFAYVASEDQA